MPRNSSSGNSVSFQVNYSLSRLSELYCYSGYSHWDKLNRTFRPEDFNSEKYDEPSFLTYSEDEHILVPFFIGLKYSPHSTDLFRSFVNFEMGYSYSKFNKYLNWITQTDTSGKILNYYPDQSSKKKVQYNLFGIGFGGGIERSVTSYLSFILSLKLNTHVNSSINGLFSRRGTYFYLGAGIKYIL